MTSQHRMISQRRNAYLRPPVKKGALVVRDPGLTTTTPDCVWLSMGIKSVDCFAGTLCIRLSNPSAAGKAEKGLDILIPALPKGKPAPRTLEARGQFHLGVVEAMSAVGHVVPLGCFTCDWPQSEALSDSVMVRRHVSCCQLCVGSTQREERRAEDKSIVPKTLMPGPEVQRLMKDRS